VKLGVSGAIARAFIDSPLTPLFLLLAFAIGGLALLALPREEEPQISVPLVDIFVRADGLKAEDAVELVTKPLEDIIKGIDGVEHVYSQTEDDEALVTARFKIGFDQDSALLRVHSEVRANMNRIPIGIPEPLIVGRGINDVPILVLTLTPKPGNPGRWDDVALLSLADELNNELMKVEDVGKTFVVGGRPVQIRVEPDPERLALYGVTLNQLVEKLEAANRSFLTGHLADAGRRLPVAAGQTLQSAPDIALLLVTTSDGRPVYVGDVARIVVDGRPDEQRVWHLAPGAEGRLDARPAVSLAIAKRKGANAVVIADHVLERLQLVRDRLVPGEIEVAVTRNYGETARDKADELLFHLLLASVSIVALLTLFLGWREGLVVLVVIPATILLTFFAAWLMGYTINRVSLFALIFSIGILVDDAIVVVENMVRHWRERRPGEALAAAVEAVAEVGNPTIVATFTIIVALLPMMFVSGLMGPYMSPIPANASAAMLFSLLVAFTVTPWLMFKLRSERQFGEGRGGGDHGHGGLLAGLYLRVARPLLVGRRRVQAFLLAIGFGTLLSLGLFYTKSVPVKLLPFDNKSELQVVLDLPRGASLEATERTLMEAAGRLADLPELVSIQLYAGTAAPFNFNGLVRHYYLRQRPELGDLQVNLRPKEERDRASHDIALDVRRRLADLALPEGAALRVVEVPPGPPVIATLLAEIYGPDAEIRRAVAARLRDIYRSVDFIVDDDVSYGTVGPRYRLAVDQENLEFHRVEEAELYGTIATLLGGKSVGYSHRGHGVNPIEIAIRLPRRDLYLGEALLSTPVPTRAGGTVQLGELVTVHEETRSYPLFRRDGRFAEMVMGELAGRFEAPIYGMLAVADAIERQAWPEGLKPVVRLAGQPADESRPTLLWDGEWEITYVTFRDMGAAFMAALLGIYLLVVAQFRNFKLPLLVLVPVPLTLLGIMLGHWLLGAAFTATSMIGFIALAGIVVRNSILLIDFIRQRRGSGAPLRDVLLEAGAIRFKPIFLTAAAAMIGAAFILADPIFQGLAISLLFGLASSTLLTVLVIPAIYVWLRDDGRPATA
jgi:multidrug efflux pump subunit AcrB